jgi:hypothetical protein
MVKKCGKSVDNGGKCDYLWGVEMNTTFSKQIKMYAVADGCLTRWQHKSRLAGVVGMEI